MRTRYHLFMAYLREQLGEHRRDEQGATFVEYALLVAGAIGFATLVLAAVTGKLQSIIGSFG